MDSRFPTLLGFFYHKFVQHLLTLRLILFFNILNYNPSRMCLNMGALPNSFHVAVLQNVLFTHS